MICEGFVGRGNISWKIGFDGILSTSFNNEFFLGTTFYF